MEAAPLISVIICVHNGERHLVETLQSVARQQPADRIEVVLIDDLSSDGSPDIIREQAARLQQSGFSVQTVFHSENKSIIQSYHEGVELSRGKYFKILDHDDTLASDRALAEPVEFMELMEERGISVGAVFSKTLYADEKGHVFGEKRFPFPFLPWEARDGLVGRNWGSFVLAFSPIYPFVHGASVVRKSCWQDLSASQIREHGSGLFDVLFAVHLMHSPKWRAAYLRSPGLCYRIHPSSYTQSVVNRGTWTDILNSHYEQLYGRGSRLALIKGWTRFIQALKSRYHRIKQGNAFKSIGAFGRH